MFEFVFADPHFGRYYADDDARTVSEKVEKTVKEILAATKGKKFSQIILAPVGDVYDSDNKQSQTTSGTQQFPAMKPHAMYRFGVESMIWMIDQLRTIAPVKYVFVPGNHDYMLSFTLAVTLEKHYQGCKDVTFITNDDSKFAWFVYGLNLLAWTHGDIPKGNRFAWLPTKASEEWGKTKHREIHCGHTNQQTVFEDVGQIIRYLPSIADASLWEDGRGYPDNIKSSCCFIWDAAEGLKQQWFINV